MKNRLYITLLTALLITVCFGGCSFLGKTTPEAPTPLPTAAGTTATVTPVPTMAQVLTEVPSAAPEATTSPVTEPTATAIPAITENVSPTMEVTATVTPEPTLPVSGDFTGAQAKQKLQNAVGEAYSVSEPEKSSINGADYYIFTIMDAEKTYTPSVIVCKQDGTIYYYYSDSEITEFSSFPPDNSEAGGTEDGGFSKDDALRLLEKISLEDLNLPEAITSYTLSVDEWTTMIRGEECYCINAYEKLADRYQLVGIYYVAVNGSLVYRDDMGDFILIY